MGKGLHLLGADKESRKTKVKRTTTKGINEQGTASSNSCSENKGKSKKYCDMFTWSS